MSDNKKRILIAEDEKPLARAISLKLEKEGFFTEMVSDGEEVEKKIISEKYDLILMDLMMPKLDGFSVLEKMKADNLKIPVIIMSNLSQETDKARVTQAGALAYFVKSDIKLFEVVTFIKETLKIK
jgi:DNA-binding response OmpR family regulator